MARLPIVTKTDPDMFKRLNEKPPNDSHRASVLSDNSIPTFQTQLPVKSMDVSDIGFRERYQSALTNVAKKNHSRGA